MEELADLLKALAHPARLQILDMLRGGEICVCHIENALDKRQPYISQQLMVLRDANVVETRKDGLQVYYRISDPRVYRLLEAVLGAPDLASFAALDDCSCPSCTSAALAQVE
jgi:ArsR family transcriptional regulator